MNAGHTGFEFYRAAPAGELAIPNRPLDPVWEAHGEIPGMPGWQFLGRRMIRFMALMNFPRYVHRESRDFFYLTLRSLLPGEAIQPVISPQEPGEGAWQTAGLPQHGWPYAISTPVLRPDATRPETKVRLVKLDPKMVTVLEQDAEARVRQADVDKTVIAFWNVPKRNRDTFTLWLTDLGPIVSEHSPIEGAKPLLSGFSPGDARAERPASAVGVDPSGMLVYAEVSTAPDPTKDRALLSKVMSLTGCREFLLLVEPLGAALGGQWGLSGHPYAKQQKGIRLVRHSSPGGRRIFESTPVVKPSVWALMQSKRTRYLHEP
jgi:hypothetical protein